jgi:hypothetical protein
VTEIPGLRLEAGGGGRGGAIGELAAPAQNQFLDKTAALAFGFDYSVTVDRHLRIVPATNGFLSVSAAGQLLVSNRALTGSATTEVPLPDGANSVTVVFSVQPITDSILNIVKTPMDAPAATMIDPNPTPASRLVAVIPIVPRQ